MEMLVSRNAFWGKCLLVRMLVWGNACLSKILSVRNAHQLGHLSVGTLICSNACLWERFSAAMLSVGTLAC